MILLEELKKNDISINVSSMAKRENIKEIELTNRKLYDIAENPNELTKEIIDKLDIESSKLLLKSLKDFVQKEQKKMFDLNTIINIQKREIENLTTLVRDLNQSKMIAKKCPISTNYQSRDKYFVKQRKEDDAPIDDEFSNSDKKETQNVNRILNDKESIYLELEDFKPSIPYNNKNVSKSWLYDQERLCLLLGDLKLTFSKGENDNILKNDFMKNSNSKMITLEITSICNSKIDLQKIEAQSLSSKLLGYLKKS